MQDRVARIQTANSFYDINGLIDQQIKMLDSIGPSMIKKATIGAIEETNRFAPEDSTAWSNEISIFRSIDINKPLLKDSYSISEVKKGDNKNITYSSKYPSKTIVEELSIQWFEKGEISLKIKANLDSRNPLFKSVRTMEMEFKDVNGLQALSHYKSEGWQKMVSKDSSLYVIEAEIIYD